MASLNDILISLKTCPNAVPAQPHPGPQAEAPIARVKLRLASQQRLCIRGGSKRLVLILDFQGRAIAFRCGSCERVALGGFAGQRSTVGTQCGIHTAPHHCQDRKCVDRHAPFHHLAAQQHLADDGGEA